ncbi:exopolysaccharide production protein, putative [Labilithrix luteola]|uniref:Exopolysaccharide production protein, putative n=1 Tax=Labilithrix luteola TaxID=1391654 RepID=A0A0K1PZ68_9BACT|nr:O-antigen ligase family protein [Labilithrix luteola]AKU98449.1 exopolysaccharide production protein, putative [Labilithrix luteola]
MAFIGALFLVVFLLLRPMDLWPEVAGLHSLEALSTLTAAGVGWETLRRRPDSAASPQLPWLAAVCALAYAVSVARLGLDRGLSAGWSITLGPFFMLLFVFAFGTMKRLRALMAVLLACLAFISVVAIHQGEQPRQCVELHEDPSEPGSEPAMIPDGRACEGARLCESEGGVPGSDYVCERVGLLGTISTQGRVRWRGQLDDPNELAVIIGALLPFLFMFGSKASDADAVRGGKRLLTLFLLGLFLFVSVWAVVLTQSRGGQIVVGIAVVSMLVRRYGWWAVIAGAMMTAPLVVLSWRSGTDADSSSAERAEILAEGLQLLKSHPLVGIGVAQFAKENPMNMAAHNSYLLIATELGVPGFLVWCGLVWMTTKVPFAIVRRPPPGLDPGTLLFAEALAASMLALHAGVFFLSFIYKTIFFVWLALPGALYIAVRAVHPEFEVRVTKRDLAGTCVLAVASIISVRVAAMSAH